jgi:uncharacterized membrane protein YccC
LLIKGIVAAVCAAGIVLTMAQAMATSTGVPPDPATESDMLLSAAERESFRQDIEHMRQNFYQASPESRRRWIESVRERRQQLDQEEDRALSGQAARIKPSRAANVEPVRTPASRALRERISD